MEDPWLWMRPYANSWRSGPDHKDEWKSTADIIELNYNRGNYTGEVKNNIYINYVYIVFI